MRITLNDCNNIFKNYANNHKQINEFKDIPEENIIASNLKYPLMWIAYVDSVPFSLGHIVVPTTVYFVDRLSEDKTNFIPLMSRMLVLANDFYTKFNENEEIEELMFDISANAEPVAMEFDDNVCGYRIKVNLRIRNDRNEDQIPLSL